MLRHVQALGRTIKVEVAFRFHVPPFGTCGLTPAECSRRDSPFEGFNF
jgi:hypothetical protein